ncbi:MULTISPECIES: hypothetical protein [unclassified Pedobacter]|uniref:hypothetical protein n=1 Tax=unclassified Pedobacter TaxID=2628915 RepID=UPI00141DDF99|nr:MULTISPECIES: hypothetical protein [unclassified Pedobacter]NII84887.1 hypothetical protein [Pedobacter sp. SG908]NMN38206.1 hypothetical protein [Pedobacter sp. SG918]
MKKLLLILTVCLAFGCKKDLDKTLTKKDWRIESVTVSPAMTIGQKTSTNYIELMGPSSCISNAMISFSKDGTYTSGSNGALCDLKPDASIKTWRRDGDQIFLSYAPQSPFILSGDKLTQTTSTPPQGGIIYTFVFVYKSK